MKTNYLSLIILFLLFFGCKKHKELSSVNPVNWSAKTANINEKDTLRYGKSYLSAYSQIYSFTEAITHRLTSTISMRNVSETDTIYILRAEYFDTKGKTVRRYFDHPIYLKPLETSEIIIDEIDDSGGTGANFIFEWKTPFACPEPIFEGVMVSTMGQQGLSFTTQGKRIQ